MTVCCINVPTIAIAIPATARSTPRAAVSARLRLFRLRMNRTEASR
jgi:hypothetical protein